MAMTSEHFQPGGMYYGMNSSLDRYNAEMAARRRAAQDFEDAQRQDTLANSAFGRQMAERNFGEQGRQFDARINVLRELLGRKMPDFYGGGAPAAAPAGLAATIGSAGGPPGNKRGFLPWGADQMSGAPVNNFLARVLGA